MVEDLNKWHNSRDEWQRYLTAYCNRTMQVFPVKETMSRSKRNKSVLKSKKVENESFLLPEEIDPFVRMGGRNANRVGKASGHDSTSG
ncbi:hypothetical protein PHMEG_00032114 [Phytophthora megakarya]|uniref:Uncharacterized protein n=1 Tax=Phytophthora megakarya TaxID=4795 RepID=A0A225UWL7_9STRA|nr:hypothetical protein PHMEG_00032114 [Phytophthora megakarya]